MRGGGHLSSTNAVLELLEMSCGGLCVALVELVTAPIADRASSFGRKVACNNSSNVNPFYGWIDDYSVASFKRKSPSLSRLVPGIYRLV